MDSPHGEHDRSWEEPLFPDEASDQGATPDAGSSQPQTTASQSPSTSTNRQIHTTGPLSAEGRAVSGQSTLVIEGDVIPRRLRRPAYEARR